MTSEVILAEPTVETLVEATGAATVVTQAGPGLPEMMQLTSDVTLLRLTTSALRMIEADTRRLTGASRSASSGAPRRPSPTVTSSSLFVPPLLLSVAPALQR